MALLNDSKNHANVAADRRLKPAATGYGLKNSATLTISQLFL